MLGVVAILMPAFVEARNRKGDKLLKDGHAAEAKNDWDTALELYEQAVDQDPADVGYLVAMRRARFQAGQKHVDAGQKLRAQGKLAEALAEFQTALVADPSSPIAIQEIKQINEILTRPQSQTRPGDSTLTPVELARRESDDRVSSMLEPPALKPTTSVIPTLKMNNQPPRVLFETVGRLAGINVVFDSQFNAGGRNYNVDLSNASLEQAFDYLALLTRTFWKPITSNTIFVTEDNVTKRRDYEDDVVKVFYVTNATSVQEFQEIATAIRTVAEIRRVFTYSAQRAMIVRDTVDKVALAEKLVHDLDKPKGEVVVDVIVMEANSQRTRDLAATIATAGSAGLNIPISFTGGTSVTTPATGGGTTTPPTSSNAIPLSRLGSISINQFSASLPGALLKALLTDSRTKVLNNPQVRASDGQKVSLKIGNRIPYATGSFQTNTAAALVSTQFNYADVGVNVDMTPQVHSDDEITLHVEVTVSSVQQYVEIGSISQPVIGQRASIADIRLKEGEVNILSGLNQSQDSIDVNGIPGLVNIPVLGHFLFGSEKRDVARGELLIALVPHIVRTPGYTAENLRGIYAGTDQVVKLNYAPRSQSNGPAAAPATAAPGAPAAQPSLAGASVIPPGAAARPSARLSFVPASITTNVGAQVQLGIQLEGVVNAAGVPPTRIRYDSTKLRLDDIVGGEMLSRGAPPVTVTKDIRNDLGEATVGLTRAPANGGINGNGTAFTLIFTAIGIGPASVNISEMSLRGPQGEVQQTSGGDLTITVQ